MHRTARALTWNALVTSAAVGACAALLGACAPPPPPPRVAPPPPPPPVVVEPPPEPLKLPGAIKFESGKSVLTADSEPTLMYVLEYFRSRPNLKQMRIEGHTDN